MKVLILIELIVGVALVAIHAFADLGRELSRQRHPLPLPSADEDDLAP